MSVVHNASALGNSPGFGPDQRGQRQQQQPGRADRWRLGDTAMADAVAATVSPFAAGPLDDPGAGYGPGHGEDDDEDVVFASASALDISTDAQSHLYRSAPPSAPAGAGAALRPPKLASRFASAYAVPAPPDGTPPKTSATTAGGGGGGGRNRSSGRGLGSGGLRALTDGLDDGFGGDDAEVKPPSSATAVAAAATAARARAALTSSSSSGAASTGAGAGFLSSDVHAGTHVLSAGALHPLPADTLTLMSGVDFDSADADTLAHDVPSSSQAARLLALKSLLALSRFGPIDTVPRSVRLQTDADTVAAAANAAAAAAAAADEDGFGGGTDDAAATAAAAADAAAAAVAPGDADVNAALAPLRRQHSRCRNPLTLLLYLVTCLVLPIVFSVLLLDDPVVVFIPGALLGVCGSVFLLAFWVREPKVAVMTAYPAGILALFAFALIVLLIGYFGYTVAALAAALLLGLHASSRLAHVESTVALARLTAGILLDNTNLFYVVPLCLSAVFVPMLAIAHTLLAIASIRPGQVAASLLSTVVAGVALYWFTQTARYVLHSVTAGVVTSWYYTQAGREHSPFGTGAGLAVTGSPDADGVLGGAEPSRTARTRLGSVLGAGGYEFDAELSDGDDAVAVFAAAAIDPTGTGAGTGAHRHHGAAAGGSARHADIFTPHTRAREHAHAHGHGHKRGARSASMAAVAAGAGDAHDGFGDDDDEEGEDPNVRAAGGRRGGFVRLSGGGLSGGGADSSSIGDGSSLSALEGGGTPDVSLADPAFRRRLLAFAAPRSQARLPFVLLARALTVSLGGIAHGAFFVGPIRWLWLGARALARTRAAGGTRAARALLALSEVLFFRYNKYAFRHMAVYGTDFSTSSHATYRNFRARGAAAVVEQDKLEGFLALVPVVIGALAATATSVVVASWGSGDGRDMHPRIFVSYVFAALLASVALELYEAVTMTLYACFGECPGVLRDTYPVLFARFVRIAEFAMVQDMQQQQQQQQQGQQQQGSLPDDRAIV